MARYITTATLCVSLLVTDGERFEDVTAVIFKEGLSQKTVVLSFQGPLH